MEVRYERLVEDPMRIGEVLAWLGVDHSHETVERLVGIGVFESREYINELGGSLEVRSRPSLGTTFVVNLPLYRRDARAVERAA